MSQNFLVLLAVSDCGLNIINVCIGDPVASFEKCLGVCVCQRDKAFNFIGLKL